MVNNTKLTQTDTDTLAHMHIECFWKKIEEA